MARYEKTCKSCGGVKMVDDVNTAKSKWYICRGKPKPPCKTCQNAARRDRRNGVPTDYRAHKVMVDWCPRDEWPRLRWFTNGHFQQMLDDGILTPGMCVTQHDKQYVVWGARGEEQWLKRAVDKRGRTKR